VSAAVSVEGEAAEKSGRCTPHCCHATHTTTTLYLSLYHSFTVNHNAHTEHFIADWLLLLLLCSVCLQCFDAVGWAAGRTPSGFHCHSLPLASVKSRLVLPFWYRLTQVVLVKRPLNGCSSSSSMFIKLYIARPTYHFFLIYTCGLTVVIKRIRYVMLCSQPRQSTFTRPWSSGNPIIIIPLSCPARVCPSPPGQRRA